MIFVIDRPFGKTDLLGINTLEMTINVNFVGNPLKEKNSLAIHMLYHTGDQSHRCKTYGAIFSHKDNLTGHSLSHNSPKRYRCYFCREEFTLQADLTRHRLIHSGAKPYICGICGESFMFEESLTSHIVSTLTINVIIVNFVGSHLQKN